MDDLRELFTTDRLLSIAKGVIVLGVGLVLARLAGRGVARLVKNRVSVQAALLLRRLVWASLSTLVLLMALSHFGFDLSILLGAAGVLTVAVGFASQTSMSNLISGVFLMVERPFVVGDLIRVSDTTGRVVSIDLLSVRLRTFDNLAVRVPNESLFKSQITTLTTYPLRRCDVNVGIAYDSDLTKVREVLMAVAEKNPHAMVEPCPILLVEGFGASSIDLQFSVWGATDVFYELKSELHAQVLEAFRDAGIEIPFPRRVIEPAAGALPVRIVGGAAEEAEGEEGDV